MTIDMALLNVVSVTIFGVFQYDSGEEDALTEEIRSYRKGWPRSPLNRLGLDVQPEFKRHVEFSVTRGPRNSRRIRVRLHGHVATDERLTKRARERQIVSLQEISDVMGHLEGMNLAGHCHAHVNWSFDAGTREPILKLPLLSTSGSSMPFESISGVRLKRPSPEGEISVILDSTAEGGLSATMQIPLGIGLSFGMIDDVLLLTDGIIKEFVFDVQPQNEEG